MTEQFDCKRGMNLKPANAAFLALPLSVLYTTIP
jgi:hypothetical protein